MKKRNNIKERVVEFYMYHNFMSVNDFRKLSFELKKKVVNIALEIYYERDDSKFETLDLYIRSNMHNIIKELNNGIEGYNLDKFIDKLTEDYYDNYCNRI